MTPDPAAELPGAAAAVAAPRRGEATGPVSEMLELSREECLRLLGDHSFGRLAVNIGEGPPVIRPVNYVFAEPSQSVVFRTAHGSKFHALLRSADAAFEIDGIDDGSRTGWSVIMHGVTDEVTNPNEVRRLDSLGLETWAPGRKAHWVQIRAWTVSGRRIVLAASTVRGDSA
jgi:nitroimidazol reductase NimA-like FMN-containing flavoprotein (pyridoxamine 5'-phosphate oxidase superfamily)